MSKFLIITSLLLSFKNNLCFTLDNVDLGKGLSQIIKDQGNSKGTPTQKTTKSSIKIVSPIEAISSVAAISLRSSLNSKNPYRYCDNTKSTFGNRLSKCPNYMLPTSEQIISYAGKYNGLIRQGNDLPQSEKNLVSNIATKINNNFKNENPVRIAFCGSGGGDRAMLSTLGFLLGAEQIDLLNKTSYIAALSGSTWILGAWLTSGQPLAFIKEQLKSNLGLPVIRLSDGLSSMPAIKKKEEILRLIKVLTTKAVFEQDIGPVDIWGCLIANHIFRGVMEPRISLRMTKTQIPNIETSNFPFPIYTAVSGDHRNGYNWYEFTPVECGSTDVSLWCPTWAFGRKMENGVSKKWRTPTSLINGSDYAPEQTLGFFLGICGSAFTINIGEVIKLLKNDINYALEKESAVFQKLSKAILQYLEENANTISAQPAKISNYTYKINNSPIKDDTHIKLRDAGLHFNIPLPPLLRKERAIDIIFVFDASSDIYTNPGAEIIAANNWASKHKVSLPNFSKVEGLGKESITVIDSDPQAPIIVYMPMIKDKALKYTGAAENFDLEKCLKQDCSTFNFAYSPDQFEGLTSLTEQNIILNKEKIKQAIEKARQRLANPWYQ